MARSGSLGQGGERWSFPAPQATAARSHSLETKAQPWPLQPWPASALAADDLLTTRTEARQVGLQAAVDRARVVHAFAEARHVAAAGGALLRGALRERRAGEGHGGENNGQAESGHRCFLKGQVSGGWRGYSGQTCHYRGGGFSAHDLVRKPVPIPDRVEDML